MSTNLSEVVAYNLHLCRAVFISVVEASKGVEYDYVRVYLLYDRVHPVPTGILKDVDP